VIGFDIRGVELTHHDGNCSFETFLKRYRLGDDGVMFVARPVHEADFGDERFYVPEAAGLDAVMRDLGLLHDDEQLLAVTARLFDGL
jgi:hypothetical protein